MCLDQRDGHCLRQSGRRVRAEMIKALISHWLRQVL